VGSARLRGFVFCPGGSAVWPQCWLCAVCAVGHVGCCVGGGGYPVGVSISSSPFSGTRAWASLPNPTLHRLSSQPLIHKKYATPAHLHNYPNLPLMHSLSFTMHFRYKASGLASASDSRSRTRGVKPWAIWPSRSSSMVCYISSSSR